MRLSGPSGDFVELRLDGYQYDAGASDAGGWDANWLFVAGSVRRGPEAWRFREPCLTTWEARQLLAWLRALPDAAPAAIEFTEPNLALRATADAAGAVTLVLTLAGEAAPPSLSEDERGGPGCPMAFPVSSAALTAATDEWERALAHHPPR